MKNITQITRRRQAIVEYSFNNSITDTAKRYNVSRSYVYRWRKRYDGTLQSLQDRSHRPKSHPNQHTEEEIKLIKDMRKKNMNTGLVVFWVKLRQRGYKRSITGLWRMLKKLDLQPINPPNPKYIPKPYEKCFTRDNEYKLMLSLFLILALLVKPNRKVRNSINTMRSD